MEPWKRNSLAAATVALALAAFGLQATTNERSSNRSAQADAGRDSDTPLGFRWTDSASVTIGSTKDLSYVVVWYCDRTGRKFDNLDVGSEMTLSGSGPIYSVAVKAGTSSQTSLSPYQCQETASERDPTLAW